MGEALVQADEIKVESIIAVQRAFAVLEKLADVNEGLTFGEIVDLLNANKAIAFKLLNTLVASRYVYRNEKTGCYCLTFKLINLGLRKMSRTHLLEQCSGVLRELADATDELIRLAVVENDTITWVSSVLSQKNFLQLNPDYSFEVRMHLHAAGKAWLSTMPTERALSLLLAHGLEPATPHSLSTVESILADLKATAKRGYAISYEEHSLGVGAIGVPIMVRQPDDHTECVGVITLAAPCVRMDRDALHASAPRLMEAASQLGKIWPLATGRQ